MQFETLKNIQKHPPKREPKPPEPEPEKEEVLAEPPTLKILIKLIDDIGHDIANAPFSTERKLREWVDLLKQIYPMIPEGNDTIKEAIQGAIKNPQVSDFSQNNKISRSKPNVKTQD